MKNILVIDDHELFSVGLQLLLPATTDCEVRIARTGAEALDMASAYPADLILLDWNLDSTPSGGALIEVLKEVFTQATVVVVSGEASPSVVRAAIEGGAAGFVPKASNVDQLLGVLDRVTRGEIVLPDESLLADGSAKAQGDRFKRAMGGVAYADLERVFPELSGRQRDVLSLVVKGLSNREVAARLGISEGTVKQHFHAVCRAVGVGNRTEAVYLMARLGLNLG